MIGRGRRWPRDTSFSSVLDQTQATTPLYPRTSSPICTTCWKAQTESQESWALVQALCSALECEAINGVQHWSSRRRPQEKTLELMGTAVSLSALRRLALRMKKSSPTFPTGLLHLPICKMEISNEFYVERVIIKIDSLVKLSAFTPSWALCFFGVSSYFWKQTRCTQNVSLCVKIMNQLKIRI